MNTRAVIKGMGLSVPDRIWTNDDLAKFVDTNDEWISQRTGIRERRVSQSHEPTSLFCTRAGREAMERAGWSPEDVDLIVVGTVTPDMPFPSTACLVQRDLGAVNAAAFDLGAACAGFIYSMEVARAMLEVGTCKRALVIGADTLTKFVDWTERSTCVLFGDGAGAAALETEVSDRGLIQTVLLADGHGAPHIQLEGGGSMFPYNDTKNCDVRNTLSMAGAEVYRFAVNAMGDACCKLLDMAGMTSADIDLFVPHQANLRIIDSAAKRLDLPAEKVFINVHKYGNTSGGSIPIALYEAEAEERLKKGDVVMTVGFGAGLVWGANLIRW